MFVLVVHVPSGDLQIRRFSPGVGRRISSLAIDIVQTRVVNGLQEEGFILPMGLIRQVEAIVTVETFELSRSLLPAASKRNFDNTRPQRRGLGMLFGHLLAQSFR